MSEIAHHDTNTQNETDTENLLENVIPLRRAPTEKSKYHELGEVESSSMLMARLRLPSVSSLRGDDLAEVVDSYLNAKTDLESETLEARLTSIVLNTLPTDDVYDRREANDIVFKHLISKIITRGNSRNTHEQRRAARNLLDLRIALPLYETDDDKTWIDVTDRLMD